MSEITVPMTTLRIYLADATLNVSVMLLNGAYAQTVLNTEVTPGDDTAELEKAWTRAKGQADYARSRGKTGKVVLYVDGRVIVTYTSGVAVTRSLRADDL